MRDIDSMSRDEMKTELLRCKRIIASMRDPEDSLDIIDDTDSFYNEEFMYDAAVQQLVDEYYELGWNEAEEYYKKYDKNTFDVDMID